MPKKTSRRGFGWSRMRPGLGLKRKRESENGEEGEESHVVIGQENEERWARVRARLGFHADMDFASFLLDLAESERLTPTESSTTDHNDNEENLPPKDNETSEEEPPQEKPGTEGEDKDYVEEKGEAQSSPEDKEPSGEEDEPMSLMMVCEDQT